MNHMNHMNHIKITFDIVSDLHIDQWSHKYINKYPCGKISEFPLKFDKINSDYLIVAGDISDDLNESINYLNEIAQYYKKILFIDGNHEHVHKYPKLYDTQYINKLISNDKIVYLPTTPYKINETLFIGCCGWWDYNNENNINIENYTHYFDNWIPEFTKEDNIEFINNVIKRAKEEYIYLNNILQKYENDDTIENIIIITHTLPHIKYCDNNSNTDNSSSQYNTQFEKLFTYKKISKWIFGHTHKIWEDTINNIEIICNPRGRPEDFNREKYNIKKIEI